MANPPISMPPFTNVPAPGSPIRSDWAQQVTAYALAHGFERKGHGLYQQAPTLNGAHILATTVPTVAWATWMRVVVHAWLGCDGSAINGPYVGVNPTIGGGTARNSPNAGTTEANRFGQLALGHVWAVPAGGNPSFDIIVGWAAVGAGTTYAVADVQWEQIRQ